jgi:cobalt/nickel transport system permease protein
VAQFLEHNIAHLMQGWNLIQRADSTGRLRGPLQRLSAPAKIVAAALLIIAVVSSTHIWAILSIFVLTLALALLSSGLLLSLMRIAWLSVLSFTGIMSLPALFLTPGPVFLRVPVTGWTVTSSGLHIFLLLLLRAETTVTITLAVILTTTWPKLLAGLRTLKIPTLVVALIGTTLRYIVLLLESALDMMQSRRSRLVGPLPPRERRRLLIATGGVLFSKSAALSQEVHDAMIARGFRGQTYLLENQRMAPGDWMAMSGVALLSVVVVFFR